MEHISEHWRRYRRARLRTYWRAVLQVDLREIYFDLLALVWPTHCVACGAPDRDCCEPCLSELRAGRGIANQIHPPAGGVAMVAGPYAGPMRALLLACKHSGRTGFASELGRRLKAPLDLAIRGRIGVSLPLIVTAPSSAAKA